MWKLPAGYADKDGKVHREVEVREMTGHDEEYLLTAKGKNFARVTTKLLASCVTRIGEVKPTEDIVRGLLIGDRNYLLLAVRIASLGEDIEFSVPCPSCRAQNAVTQNLTELPIKEMVDPTDLEKEVKLPAPVELPDKTSSDRAVITFLTGKDQEELSMYQEDAAQLINATLVKSLKRIGAWDKISVEFVKDLTKRNRDAIMAAIKAATPGVDMNTTVECGSCGASFQTPVGMEGFFVSRAA